MSAADDETLAAAVALADAIPEQPPSLEDLAASSQEKDTPPKRSRRSSSRVRTPRPERTPRAPRGAAAPKLAPRMEALHELIGGGLAVGAMVGKVPAPVGAFGESIAEDAKALGEAWEAYAKVNPRVRDALERLLTVSELGAILGLYAKAGYRAYASSAAASGLPDMTAMFTAAEAEQTAA